VHVSAGAKSAKEARTMSAAAPIVVKWSGKEYTVDSLGEEDDVAALKAAIQAATGVRPERQKLLNLKAKGMQPAAFSASAGIFRIPCTRIKKFRPK
jgi:DNA-binding LytR/AlgR family response regulator